MVARIRPCLALFAVVFGLIIPGINGSARAKMEQASPPEYIAINDSTFVPVYELDAVAVTGSRTEQRLADFLFKASGVAVSQTIFGSGIQLQRLGSELR